MHNKALIKTAPTINLENRYKTDTLNHFLFHIDYNE